VVNLDVNTSLENVQPMANNDPSNIINLHMFVVAEVRFNQNPLLKPSQERIYILLLNIRNQQNDTENSDSVPLLVTDALKVHGISESTRLSTITILGNKIIFKLDTGAEARVLPLKIYKHLKDKLMLENLTSKLSAYGGLCSHQLVHMSLNSKQSLLLPLLDFLMSLEKFSSY